jgi:DNA-binding NtrC family response regulator
MPFTTQVRLLRALESKEFMRVGAETVTKVDVRIIAATNKDLQYEVEARRFREDLYFRLKAVTLSIPPLRKRKGDIEELTRHLINNYCTENNIVPPLITDDALDLLRNYDWPGNIRELKNAVESATALNRDGVLNAQVFIPLIKINQVHNENRNLPIYLKRSPEEVDRELLYRALFEIKKDIMEIKDLIYSQQIDVKANENNGNIDEVVSLQQVEKEAIINALDHSKGNKRNAAKMLKISERTLYRKIKEYGL